MASSKSDSQILQDFVGDLLKDPGIEFDAPDVELSEVNTELIEPELMLSSIHSEESEEDAASHSEPDLILTNIPEQKPTLKPLLSERLQTAKSLLQAMPTVDEMMQHPDTEVSLPQVLEKDDLLSAIEGIPDDEIIIIEEVVEHTTDEIDAELTFTEFEEINQGQNNNKIKRSISSPLQNGIPEWGRGSFQTLIFKIGELKLALPLIKLGGIHRLDSEPTPMPENAPWFMGLIADEQGSISVIDTALWIMPEKYQIARQKGLDYEFIILLDNTRWGLACSKVDNAIILSEEDIRWNNKNSKRPWLAGMVIDEMCALLDVETLVKMLDGKNAEQSSIST